MYSSYLWLRRPLARHGTHSNGVAEGRRQLYLLSPCWWYRTCDITIRCSSSERLSGSERVGEAGESKERRAVFIITINVTSCGGVKGEFIQLAQRRICASLVAIRTASRCSFKAELYQVPARELVPAACYMKFQWRARRGLRFLPLALGSGHYPS